MSTNFLKALAFGATVAFFAAGPAMAEGYSGGGKLDLGGGKYFGMEAGPIWSNKEAAQKCKAACTVHWNGAWVTKIANKQSLCAVMNKAADGKSYHIKDANGENAGLDAGPIWNNKDAKDKCMKVAAGVKWVTNNWITTEEGKMSLCACTGAKQVNWRPNTIEK